MVLVDGYTPFSLCLDFLVTDNLGGFFDGLGFGFDQFGDGFQLIVELEDCVFG